MYQFFKKVFLRKSIYLLVIVISLFTALYFYLHHFSASAFPQHEDVFNIFRGNTEKEHVAITFNVTWGDEKIVDILSTLKDNNVKATFFVSGEWAERHPQLLSDIERDGHEVGMLGYRFTNYVDGDLKDVEKDLRFAKGFFHKLGYEKMTYVRTPNYLFNDDILSIAEKLNLTYIHWSVNPYDYKNPGVNKISNTVISNSKPGDIILLHASDSAKQTAESLQSIVPALKNKYKVVTISELTSKATVEEKLLE